MQVRSAGARQALRPSAAEPCRHSRRAGWVLAAAALVAGPLQAAPPLPRLPNIDTTQATVSGISAGAYMAGQLGWAYSAYFRGVGLFAGGPYGCGGHNHYANCMRSSEIGPAQVQAMQAGIDAGSGRWIDAKSNLAGQRVFFFVGAADAVVGPQLIEAARQQYLANGAAAANLHPTVVHDRAGHVFPIAAGIADTSECGNHGPPFIRNCGYDGAGRMLEWLYGPLAPPQPAAEGSFLQFDQRAFSANPGLADTGWVYVPADCAGGASCRLHVALHGCQQTQEHIKDAFVKQAGYAPWAEANRIVVLFPQARRDFVVRRTAASLFQPNPLGCFDWVGWYGRDFARRSGAQVAAIKAMVDHLSSAPSLCRTARNQDHVRAGRADLAWPQVLARGSGHRLGSAGGRSTLRQIGSANFHVAGGC